MPDVLSVGLGGGSHVEQSQVSIVLAHVMHLSMLSHWVGGGGRRRPGIGGGFDVTSLPVVGTFDHSLSSFDQQY